jgi:hypothetical protein
MELIVGDRVPDDVGARLYQCRVSRDARRRDAGAAPPGDGPVRRP